MYSIKNILGLILLLITIVSPKISSSQDIHFSQFYASRLIVNPAMTGFINEEYRVGAQFRSQWNGFTNGYTTIGASAEGSFFKGRWRDDYFGAGLQMYRDFAGDAALGNNTIALSGAYSKGLGNDGRHALALGFQALAYQLTINPGDLYFDNQYNGVILDTDIPPSSFVNSASDISFDLAAGLNYHFIPGDAFNFYAGISAYQILESEANLLTEGVAKRNRRYTAHFAGDFYVSRPMNILIAGMYLQQASLRQINTGFMLQFFLDDHNLESPTRFNIGTFLRYSSPLPDALIVSARMDYQNVSLGMSYDFNISGLNTSSDFRGAYELSLFYNGLFTTAGQRNFVMPCPSL
ncbi:MAG: type IX secretion system membrane protein PorP/SprF [Chitinophagaceae bacterium]|nr:MAG: type IX secretion system membrane protein PorP/SprF [Chitinophagaceae bacterium]